MLLNFVFCVCFPTCALPTSQCVRSRAVSCLGLQPFPETHETRDSPANRRVGPGFTAPDWTDHRIGPVGESIMSDS